MKFIVFDTETTGLPPKAKLCMENLNEWPYIVQFSYIVYDLERNEITDTIDAIIKLPSSVQIPSEAAAIHGITDEISQSKGVELYPIIKQFLYTLTTVDRLIGHNISFDLQMLRANMMRIIRDNSANSANSSLLTPRELFNFKSDLEYINKYHSKNIYCTMRKTIKRCNLIRINKNGGRYLKFPKLSELYEVLFGNVPENMHNSLYDVLATLRCYLMLEYKMI
jgi:DNA polymerase III epsilon subunit-like protein